MSTQTAHLRVFRFKRGDASGHFDEFEVPVDPKTTLLETLHRVQLRQDGTLALRHSCQHAACGTCGMQANGREVLACVTAMGDLGRKVTVEPLANLPVLADLVVDMSGLYSRFYDRHPVVRTSELLPEAERPEGAGGFVRYEDCIECGLCLSACPIAATAHGYAGPAALAAAERLVEEPRDADVRDVLRWAGDADGVWRCHAAYECTEVCPADVKPAERIMKLRGALLRGGRSLRRVPA
jgi:succinate dehydrogenase / fumarate reductase iron-sulfur subunit